MYVIFDTFVFHFMFFYLLFTYSEVTRDDPSTWSPEHLMKAGEELLIRWHCSRYHESHELQNLIVTVCCMVVKKKMAMVPFCYHTEFVIAPFKCMVNNGLRFRYKVTKYLQVRSIWYHGFSPV